MLQEAVLGRGRGLHKSAFCCNPPFSATPSPAGIGRLLQSAVLGSAASYTKRAFAAICRPRRRRALHKLVACSKRPWARRTRPYTYRSYVAFDRSRQSPRLTQIGHLQQTATASPGSASPLSRSQFPRNLSKYTFNGQVLARFPRNLWITARRPLSALAVCAELRFLPRGFAQTRSSFRISAAKTAKSAALLQTVRTEAQFATNRNTGAGRGEGDRRSPRPAPTRRQTPSAEANLIIVRFPLIRLPHR